MIKKGLVVKINKDSATVLTDDSIYERIVLRGDMKVGMKVMFTDNDLYSTTIIRRIDFMKKKGIVVAAAIAVMVLAASVFGFNLMGVPDAQYSVAAVVTVDINPSFKISVDSDKKVVELEPLNEDAESIDVSDLIGRSIEDAVEEIVKRAEAAGFLDIKDLEDDYILITAIDTDDTDDTDKEDEEDEDKVDEDKDEDKLSEELNDLVEDILESIREKSEKSDVLSGVNIALIEATREQLEDAVRQNIPVGLYTLTGDKNFSVKEFFADEGRAEEFLKVGQISESSFEYQVGLIATYMDEIEEGTSLKNDLQVAFEASKADFFESKRLFEEAREEYKEALKSGDEDRIAEAEEILSRAEAFKDMMENYKDQIESIKEILKEAIEGEASDEELLEKVVIADMNRRTEEAKMEKEQARLQEKAAKEEEKRLEEKEREEEKAAKEEEKRLEEKEREEEKAAKEEEKRLEEKEREEEKAAKEEQKRLEEKEREEEKLEEEAQERLEEKEREEELEEEQEREEELEEETQKRLEEQKREEEKNSEESEDLLEEDED